MLRNAQAHGFWLTGTLETGYGAGANLSKMQGIEFDEDIPDNQCDALSVGIVSILTRTSFPNLYSMTQNHLNHWNSGAIPSTSTVFTRAPWISNHGRREFFGPFVACSRRLAPSARAVAWWLSSQTT
jgi:hypothetical protein